MKVPAEFGRTHPMFIDGNGVRSRDGTFEDTSPANRKLVLGRFQKGTRADADRAVTAARAGFPAWSSVPYGERARIMQRAADLMSERKFLLAALMTFGVLLLTGGSIGSSAAHGVSRPQIAVRSCRPTSCWTYWRIVGPGSGFIRRMLAPAKADAEREGLP